jgi:hypothetical protein
MQRVRENLLDGCGVPLLAAGFRFDAQLVQVVGDALECAPASPSSHPIDCGLLRVGPDQPVTIANMSRLPLFFMFPSPYGAVCRTGRAYTTLAFIQPHGWGYAASRGELDEVTCGAARS